MNSFEVIKTVNNHWDTLKAQLNDGWIDFVETCGLALQQYRENPDPHAVDALAGRLIRSLYKTYEGKVALEKYGFAGMRLSTNEPKDSHPTDAVKNSVNELANKIEQEQLPKDKNPPRQPGQN